MSDHIKLLAMYVSLAWISELGAQITFDDFNSAGSNARAIQQDGFQLPGNKAGNIIRLFPNMILPGTSRDLPYDPRLESPFMDKFQSTYIDDKDYYSGVSYGMGVGPTNFLSIPVQKDLRLLQVPYNSNKSDLKKQLLGRAFNPFTSVLGTGIEFDSNQEVTDGNLSLGVGPAGNKWDINGIVGHSHGFVMGGLDFPLKNGRRFPISGWVGDGQDDQVHNIGLVNSPTNSLGVPINKIMQNTGLFQNGNLFLPS